MATTAPSIATVTGCPATRVNASITPIANISENVVAAALCSRMRPGSTALRTLALRTAADNCTSQFCGTDLCPPRTGFRAGQSAGISRASRPNRTLPVESAARSAVMCAGTGFEGGPGMCWPLDRRPRPWLDEFGWVAGHPQSHSE